MDNLELLIQKAWSGEEIYHEELHQEVLRHPLLAEHIHRMRAGFIRPLRITNPREVLAEKLYYASLLLSNKTKRRSGATFEWSPRDHAAVAYTLLKDAPAYLWTVEQWMLAISAPLPPHHVEPRQLPTPNVWFTFEEEMRLSIEPDASSLVTVDALLLCETAHQVTMFIFGVSVEGNISIATTIIHTGCRYPEDYAEKDRPAIGKLLAALSFLRSPHIEKRESGLNRGERRGLYHQGTDPNVIDNRVNFITLRRHYQAKHRGELAGKPEETTEHRKYDHYQWMVSGHHRNQFYASTNSHRMIWISPYLKGPEDKPLKQKMYKVVR